MDLDNYYREKSKSALEQSANLTNFINMRLAKLKELEDRLKALEDKIFAVKARIHKRHGRAVKSR